jgi:hypothetical protein
MAALNWYALFATKLDFGQKFNGSFEAQNKGRVNFFTVTAKPRQGQNSLLYQFTRSA